MKLIDEKKKSKIGLLNAVKDQDVQLNGKL